jgi:hypothetical protein|tara:strand:+ start:919 stop:1386 length:468 start_codon:yes stop_codon:yes gene_type:complete
MAKKIKTSKKEKSLIDKLNKIIKVKKGIPRIVAEAMVEPAKKLAEKYTGDTLTKILKGISKHKDKIEDIPGYNADIVKRKAANAKNIRMKNVQLEDADRFQKSKTGGAEVYQEPYMRPLTSRKSGGKVKKLQSGGRVGAPRGTGAALRGFGKGYK